MLLEDAAAASSATSPGTPSTRRAPPPPPPHHHPSTAPRGLPHAAAQDSAYVYVGGLPFDLTEGDVIAVMSQYGEIVDVNLVRDRDTGKSKGFSFVAYEDQRSTVLAVDNLNGFEVRGATPRSLADRRRHTDAQRRASCWAGLCASITSLATRRRSCARTRKSGRSSLSA